MDYINNNEPNDDFTRSLQEEVELQRDDDGKRALYMIYDTTLMDGERMKPEKSNTAKTRRIILNSKNSVAVKEAIREVSKEVMEKNKELYRRLAYK